MDVARGKRSLYSGSPRAGQSGYRIVAGPDFPHLSRPVLGFTQPRIKCGAGSLCPGVKRPGHGVEYSPLSGTEVKQRVAIPVLRLYGDLLPLFVWARYNVNKVRCLLCVVICLSGFSCMRVHFHTLHN